MKTYLQDLLASSQTPWMTRDKAQKRVEERLDEMMTNSELDLVIIPETIMEVSCGWVFFYQSRDFVEQGNQSEALAGNAPILVDQRNGSLHIVGTTRSIEYYVQNYEDTGDPHIEAVPALVVSGWQEGAAKISATKLFNQETELGLVRSKRCVDDALDGISTTIQLDSFQEAEKLRKALDDFGWIVKVERQIPEKSQSRF